MRSLVQLQLGPLTILDLTIIGKFQRISSSVRVGRVMRQLIRVLIALFGAVAISIIVKSKEAGNVPLQSGGWRELETD